MYSLAVSLLYALVWAVWPSVADAAVVAFVALLLVPACYSETRRRG